MVSLRAWAAAAASIMWMVLVSAAYFATFPVSGLVEGLPLQKVFSPRWGLAVHFLFAALVLAGSHGLARFIWVKEGLTRAEKTVLASGTGLGIMSLSVFLLTAAGIAGKASYSLILASGLALFAFSFRYFPRQFSISFNLPSVLSVLALAATVTGALAPPTQFDSLVYHLALPAKYIREGRFFAVTDNFFFAFPQAMEMLYQMAIELDGDILANLLHWIFLPLTALGIFELARRFWDTRTGWAAAIIWFYTPSAMLISTGTYVDLSLAFFIFCSVYAFLFWHQTGKSFYLYLSAALSGIACGVKYTAAANTAILFSLLLFTGFQREYRNGNPGSLRAFSPVHAMRPAFTYLVVVFSVFLPWLLKNLFFLGNPAAPWGSAVFGTSSAAAQKASEYFAHIASHGSSLGTIKDIALLPWNMTYSGAVFGGGFDILGPVFLAFTPFLFLRMKIDKIEKILLVYIMFFMLIWIFTGKVMRFMVPVIPFLCLFAAKGFLNLTQVLPGRIIRTAAAVLFAALLAHNFLFYHWVMASVDPYSFVTGGLSRDEYLGKKLNYYAAAVGGANTLAPRARTVFLGETRSYYFTGDVIAPTVFDTNPFIEAANASSSADELRARSRGLGITHVLMNNYEFERLSMKSRFTEQGYDNWRVLRDNFAETVYRDRYCDIYEIND